jgi:putative toxin-antitoxin system antitoxin component (TIGR02293 family)
MTIKSSHSTRSQSAGRTKPAVKRKPLKRPASKKLGAKKVARKAMASAAHSHVIERSTATRLGYTTGLAHSRALAPSSSKGAEFKLMSMRPKRNTFETFGELPSAEREAAIRAGLPASFLDEAIAKLGVTRADLLTGVGISSSTAARVKQHRKRFSLQDSERLARLARLWREALIVYESEQGTKDWLTSPIPSAGGAPLAMLATQEGFERAQRSIMQLAYGVFA